MFQQLADLGSDSVPDSIKPCIEDSIDGLSREMRVSALGDGEEILEDIHAVEELKGWERHHCSMWSSPRLRNCMGGTAVALEAIVSTEMLDAWVGKVGGERGLGLPE